MTPPVTPTAAGERAPAAAGLSLRAVRVSYAGPGGPVTVLGGVDLHVAPGEVVAVAGRSGSGKTTLLTVATGWVAPDAGEARLDGTPVDADRPWSDVAVVPQALGLLDELTVAENVGLPGRLRPAAGADTRVDPHADAVAALLAGLGLRHLADRHPDEVSLGEQQRAALARAAVARPRLLVADEPVAHQNRAWAEAVLDLLSGLAAAGTTVLLASHDALVFEHADRVLELTGGVLHHRAG